MLILSGLKHSVDVEKVANKWVDNHAAALSSKSPESDSARRWININVRLQTKALEAALKQIYGSGWAFGNTDSEAQLYGEIADPWAGWNAGNEAAAALVDPPKGLKNLLDKSGITLEGIIGTTLDQMGTQLADSLSRGLGARETADNLLNVINDPARAMVIARTETARAVCDSNVANYSENGVTQMQWISADPCVLCAENEGVIVEIGEPFPTGDEYPPAHPNCVCDVSPIGSVDKTINKYSPDQERDERGRFGSGSGESESTPDYHMQHQPTLREDEFGSPAHDIEEMMPQFYEHPEWYTIHSGDEFEKASKESVAAVMAMRDNPDAVVTIYRAVPTSVSEINRGDFITLSPTYAAMHNESSLNSEGHVISMEVTAKDLWFNGDSINEFGYDPVPDSKFVDSDLNKYSPDQERDDNGRFGSGSGESKPEKTGYKGIDAVIAKLPQGWTADNIGNLAAFTNESGTVKVAGRDFDLRMIGTQNVIDAMIMADKMQEINPIGKEGSPLQITIDTGVFEDTGKLNGGADAKTAYAMSPIGGHEIYINPSMLGSGNGQSFETQNFMQPDEPVNLITYTIAHEWGHLLDMNAGAVQRDALFADATPSEVSPYGMSSAYECIAESYALWALSDGNASNPFVNEVATANSWQIGLSQNEILSQQLANAGRAQKADGSTYIYCSFDPDVQPVLTDTLPQVSKFADLNKYSPDQERDERGRFGAGTGGSNELSHSERAALQRKYDVQQKKLYKAERIVTEKYQHLDQSTRPVAPKSSDFETRKEYEQAYKEYTKEFAAWATEGNTILVSDSAQEMLDGTPEGLKNYIESVVTSDWFVEQFGTALPTPEIKLVSSKSFSGQYRYGESIKGLVNEIKIDRISAQDEFTILHEIAHYATTRSVTEPYEGHGAQFAQNSLFIISQVIGDEVASEFEQAYDEKNVVRGTTQWPNAAPSLNESSNE